MNSLENYLKEKYSKNAYKSHICTINKYLNFIQNKAKTADYKDILQYIAHLRKNENLHAKTIKQCLWSVKNYYNYLLETGQREDHPCRELFLKDKIDRQIKVDGLYSTESLENYLQKTNQTKDEKLRRRNEVIVSLLVYQGLTTMEICNLQIEDINLEKAEITIQPNGKNKSRILPLKAKQILLFYHYLQEDYPKLTKHLKTENPKRLITGRLQEKATPSVLNEMINRNRPKNERLQPIKIRQSVIANLLKKENDTRIVQVFAGHKRASTTIKYKQTELEILQNAINKCHPIR
jgi:site-specific recombinase XerD